jgi:mono/diheme cytochrome c family protein
LKLNLNRIAFIVLAAAIGTPAFAQSGGADVYKSKCAMCHGQDGLGVTPAGKAMKVVSFKDQVLVKASDVELITAATKGKNKMPAYEGKLSDAQIKAAIGYVRTLQK